MEMKEEVMYEIFLDNHKAYEALDRNRRLEILEAYGVGMWVFCILQHYWDQLTMAAWAGG